MKLQNIKKWAVSSIAALALVGLMTACETTQTQANAGVAAIALTGGSPAGAKITVDLLSFQPVSDLQREIKVQPGQHYVRVEKNGTILMDREVALTAGQTFEVPLP